MFLPFLKNPRATKSMAREDFRDLLQGYLRRLTSQNQNDRYSARLTSLQPHQDACAALLSGQNGNVCDARAKRCFATFCSGQAIKFFAARADGREAALRVTGK
ncbi:MAG: hypothetical protein H7Z21_17195 [Hymenobacter sp.]|nr:hypothetical protein [Hymenobacter sp.]